MTDKKPCSCLCHRDGFELMHCMPCCDFTYQKYISKDGTIDEERYNNLKNGKEKNNTSS